MPTTRRSLPLRAAFTLFELLVVIIILLALVVVTVPAFSRLLESANFAGAVNSVTGTLGNARAIAISRGQPAGVVFLFDTQTQEYTLQVVELVRAGTRADLIASNDRAQDNLDSKGWGVRPAINTTPVTLPKGTGVYGLSFNHAPPRLRDTQSASEPAEVRALNRVAPPMLGQVSETQQWYAGELFTHPQRNQWLVNPWIFPRNDPRLFVDDDRITSEAKRRAGVTYQDVWDRVAGRSVDNFVLTQTDAKRAVRHANSFLVLFSAAGVVVNMHDGGGAAVDYDFYLEFPDDPVDAAPTGGADPEPYDSPFAFDPEFVPDNVTRPSPNPEVLLRAVDMLAVVNFTTLLAGTQVDRPWLLHPSTSLAPWPRFRGTAETASVPLQPNDDALNEIVVRVSAWIDDNAEIISFDRYSGAAQRRRDAQ